MKGKKKWSSSAVLARMVIPFLAVATIIALAGPGATASISSSPARVVSVSPIHPQEGRARVADIVLSRPLIESVLHTPPLDTTIRFNIHAFTVLMPKSFHSTITLYHWVPYTVFRHPGKWQQVGGARHWVIEDLAPTGQGTVLKIPNPWVCDDPGRYFVHMHFFGITEAGNFDETNIDFPWGGFNRKDLSKGNFHIPPKVREAWKTKCQGGDLLIG